jgi:tryptophan 2,3-dioxygenase
MYFCFNRIVILRRENLVVSGFVNLFRIFKAMEEGELNPEMLKLLKQLQDKYASSGQDLNAYLEGLLYADYLAYWDYIHLDTLLSLQNPQTNLPDEQIFIGYHQITELYLKLILWELTQITNLPAPDENIFISKIHRINRYFEHLAHSFDIMSDGMDQEQFLKFRMTLFPASGFQSAQLRHIEFASTPMVNLVAEEERTSAGSLQDLEALFDKIYWKKGAMDKSTGKKTLTLQQFENKYSESFLKSLREYKEKNICFLYERYYKFGEKAEQITLLLKKYDQLINVHWRLSHYKSAVKYLLQDPNVLKASGGTNWQKYLPPRFQKVSFFPQLWTDSELKDWGKAWVMKEIFQKHSEDIL